MGGEQGRAACAESEGPLLLSLIERLGITSKLASTQQQMLAGLQAEVGVGRRFTYKGGYFETRDSLRRGNGKWEGCPDLFGDSPGADIFRCAMA